MVARRSFTLNAENAPPEDATLTIDHADWSQARKISLSGVLARVSHTVGVLRVLYGGLTGLRLTPHIEEPDPIHRVDGMMVFAEGTAWDPLALALGRGYLVVWSGGAWRAT
jgi:hypothetical protein